MPSTLPAPSQAASAGGAPLSEQVRPNSSPRSHYRSGESVGGIARRALQRVSPLSIALGASAVALALGIFQLSQPNAIGGLLTYDDGVYAGVGMRLVQGVLPYRDFVYLHPPGMALVTVPFALIGLAAGSHVTLGLDRVLTVVVAALNPALAGLLVRKSGRLAVAVASFALALWPLTPTADTGVRLEPFVVMFVLLGALVLFRSESPSWRRLLAGGLLVGFACTIKVWGLMPALAMLLVWAPSWRRGRWVALGVGLGGLIPCLPFFLAAPHAFLHEVVGDQLIRQQIISTPFTERLALIAGIGSANGIGPMYLPTALILVAWALGAVGAVLGFGLAWRERTRTEWFALAAGVITFLAMMRSPIIANFYAYFPAAVLAPLVGLSAAFCWRAVRALSGRTAGSHLVRKATASLVAVALLVGAATAVSDVGSFDVSYLSNGWTPTGLSRYIPSGACVIADNVAFLEVTDRLAPSQAGCPAVIDSFGMYLAEDNGLQPHPTPPYPAAFVDQWLVYLSQASYVLLSVPYSDFLPWSPFSMQWFNRNYRLVARFVDPIVTPFTGRPSLTSHVIFLYARVS